MKKLIPITILLICFAQASAFAGTTLNARISFEIPNFVRTATNEKQILNGKIVNDDSRFIGNEENAGAVAEVPSVTSNCRWNVVVMNEKKFMDAGAINYGKETGENTINLESVATDAAEKLIASGKADSGAKTGSAARDLELSYTFFAD